MSILLPLQIGVNVLIGSLMTRHVPASERVDFSRAAVERRLKIEGLLSMFAIIAGHSLVVGFIRKEGLRVFLAMAEVRLATEVHRALVPVVSRRIGEFEFYGASVPSGQIGGDLVDVTEHDAEFVAYVADVSGHGVPAGMIMAMVKSAARMGSSSGAGLSTFLSDLNRVLLSVSAPNVFVTFACISGTGVTASNLLSPDTCLCFTTGGGCTRLRNGWFQTFHWLSCPIRRSRRLASSAKKAMCWPF